MNALNKANQKIIRDFTHEEECPACFGARLNPAALGSRLDGNNIAEMGDLEIIDLISVLEKIDNPVGLPAAKKITRSLR